MPVCSTRYFEISGDLSALRLVVSAYDDVDRTIPCVVPD